MPVAPTTISNYAPWGNAQLAFELGTAVTSIDPATGNVVQEKVTVEYLAALSLEAPDWKADSGVDQTVYTCKGRLLSPSVLDPRITNGSQAQAVIDGYQGRFEFVMGKLPLGLTDPDTRQSITGTFRVVGGPI